MGPKNIFLEEEFGGGGWFFFGGSYVCGMVRNDLHNVVQGFQTLLSNVWNLWTKLVGDQYGERK